LAAWDCLCILTLARLTLRTALCALISIEASNGLSAPSRTKILQQWSNQRCWQLDFGIQTVAERRSRG
jgi:hypothetical protein